MPKPFRILTYNIDTNFSRVEEGIARDTHPEWRAGAREPLIRAALERMLKAERIDLVHIQETRRLATKYGDMVDTVTPVVDTLKALGYMTLVSPYSPGFDKTFHYVTAYLHEPLTLKGSFSHYLTKTPGMPTQRPSTEGLSKEAVANLEAHIKANNFGTLWERNVLVSEFVTADGETLWSINVHIDLTNQVRIESAKVIYRLCDELAKRPPNAKLVAAGDFNSFSDQIGEMQMHTMRGGVATQGPQVLAEATEDLRLPDGRRIGFSFIAFPSDLFDVTEEMIPDAVDRLKDAELREQARTVYQSLAGPGFNLTTFYSKLQIAARTAVMWSLHEVARASSGMLDRVFYHGFKSARARLIPAATRSLEGVDILDHDQLRSFIADPQHRAPAFASDHQPIVVEFGSA